MILLSFHFFYPYISLFYLHNLICPYKKPRFYVQETGFISEKGSNLYKILIPALLGIIVLLLVIILVVVLKDDFKDDDKFDNNNNSSYSENYDDDYYEVNNTVVDNNDKEDTNTTTDNNGNSSNSSRERGFEEKYPNRPKTGENL